jgi:hypothetical protein
MKLVSGSGYSILQIDDLLTQVTLDYASRFWVTSAITHHEWPNPELG